MIASAPAGPLFPAIAGGGLLPAQNVLAVHCDAKALDLLSGFPGEAYHLLTAGSEKQAWGLLADKMVQLLIINTEGDSASGGQKLCARVKSSHQFSHTLVVLVTAKDDLPAKIGCLAAGADAVIEAPLSREYFQAQVRNLIANRSRVKEHLTQVHSIRPRPIPRETAGNEAFLSRLNDIISDNLSNIGLTVELLARVMNMSRPTLYRKISSVSDLTPNELINIVRLNKAAALLLSSEDRVFQIAKRVGFNSRSNFGKAFLKHFGVTPTIYQRMAII